MNSRARQSTSSAATLLPAKADDAPAALAVEFPLVEQSNSDQSAVDLPFADPMLEMNNQPLSEPKAMAASPAHNPAEPASRLMVN